MKIGEMNLSFPELNADVRLTNIEVDYTDLKDILETIKQLSTDNLKAEEAQQKVSKDETEKLLIRERIVKSEVEKTQVEVAKLQVEERIKHMETQKRP